MAMVLILVLWDTQPLPSLVAGTIVYVVALIFLRPLDYAELDQLLKIMPDRLKHSSIVLAVLGDKRKAMVKPYQKWEHPSDEE